MLANWGEYCEAGWISSNHKDAYCAENRVKRFLDSCAMFLLISNGYRDIETAQKRSTIERAEVPMSLFPNIDKPPEVKQVRKVLKKKGLTTFQKIEHLKRQYPNASLEWVNVLADGSFLYKTHRGLVNPEGSYAPCKTGYDDTFYPFDRLLVVEDEDKILFYDQAVEPLLGAARIDH